MLLNGNVKGAAIPGKDLYRALLRVWLGEHPMLAPPSSALCSARSSEEAVLLLLASEQQHDAGRDRR